jgi:hypothetical protein
LGSNIEVFPNCIEAGLCPSILKGRKSVQNGRRGSLNPLEKWLDPFATGSILQTPSQILGSGVFPIEVATISSMWLRREILNYF